MCDRQEGFANSDPKEEERCYSEAIRLKPDLAAIYYNRAWIWENKRQ